MPADIRLINAKDLFVSQSTLSGEVEPIEKTANPLQDVDHKGIEDLANVCLLGTSVVSGSASGIVIATGNQTYLGAMMRTVLSAKKETSFALGMNRVSHLLIRFMMVMVVLVFLLNGMSKGNWGEAFFFSLSLAIGLTPEMLPMIITTNLAKGAMKMAKHKTIVKRLDAIQNLGAMDLLCTDKTGTLTLDQIVVERHLNVYGEEDERVLRHAYLNAHFQTGLRNMMDLALLEHGVASGFRPLVDQFEKVDEIPFDFTRRRMSVVLQSQDSKRQLITKGAVEEMLALCTLVDYKGDVMQLTPDLKTTITSMVRALNEDGMRVIAIAQKNEIPDEHHFSVADEMAMVFLGCIGFLDPAKESAKEALAGLRSQGIKVKILTGDNEIVTQKICKDVGIEVENVLLGPQIEALDDDHLAKQLPNIQVCAKLSPLQKSRIIALLQQSGHVVGFMGDGINDAAALQQADVGISVDTAVDVAKEAADIILLEKDLRVLQSGVLEGRRVFGNIMKYIKMSVSSNFGNALSVLVASVVLPFLPMLPIQFLLQNLLYDLSQISIPWDRMDAEYLQQPKKWKADDIGRFMVVMGPVSTLFDLVTFAVLWFLFQANGVAHQALFQTGWFVEGLLSQTLIIHMIRTKKIPFVQSRASTPVLLLSTLIMGVGIVLPFTMLGAAVGFVAYPLHYLPFVGAILLCYLVFAQGVKWLFIKAFHSWL